MDYAYTYIHMYIYRDTYICLLNGGAKSNSGGTSVSQMWFTTNVREKALAFNIN